MTKNICGGKGAKKRARKYINNRNQPRQMVYKKTDQEYAKLTKALGCRRFNCICSDGETRLAHVPGSLQWIRFREGDIVLVSIRIGIDATRCDILHKYNPVETRQLEDEKLIDNLSDSNDEMDENAFLQSLEEEQNEEEGNKVDINIDEIDLDDI